MTDRELLELAAKAAGIDGSYQEQYYGNGVWTKGISRGIGSWNPLAGDGAALLLAARLELDVMHRVVGGRRIEVLAAGGPLIKHFYEGDIAAAMRRAIVMTAAEIGAQGNDKQKGSAS